MFSCVRTRAAKKNPRVDRSMRWHKGVARQHVLAAGALQAHYVPGVINFEVSARHDDVDRRPMRRGVGASEDYPMSMIDAAAKLPSPFDAIAAISRARGSLR